MFTIHLIVQQFKEEEGWGGGGGGGAHAQFQRSGKKDHAPFLCIYLSSVQLGP